MPDAKDGARAGLTIHIIDQQIVQESRHPPFTSAILTRMPLERKEAKAVASGLDGRRNSVSNVRIVLSDEGANLP